MSAWWRTVQIFHSDCQGGLDLFVRFGIIARARQCPRVGIECEDIVTAGDLAARNFDGLGRIFGVVDVIGDQFPVGVIGPFRLRAGQRFEFAETRLRFLLLAGQFLGLAS